MNQYTYHATPPIDASLSELATKVTRYQNCIGPIMDHHFNHHLNRTIVLQGKMSCSYRSHHLDEGKLSERDVDFQLKSQFACVSHRSGGVKGF